MKTVFSDSSSSGLPFSLSEQSEWLFILIALILIPGIILFFSAKYFGKVERATPLNAVIIALLSFIISYFATFYIGAMMRPLTNSPDLISIIIQLVVFITLVILLGKLFWKSDLRSVIKSVAPLILLLVLLAIALNL